MEFIELVKMLGVASTNPFSFVGYIFLIVAWVYVSNSNKKIKILSKSFKDLTEKERIEIIKAEYSTSPRRGLSAEQWLRARKHFLLFLGFMASITAIIIVLVVLVMKLPAFNSHVSKLNEPRLLRKSDNKANNLISDAYFDGTENSNEKSLLVGEILQGKSGNEASLIFDINLKNLSDKYIILQELQIVWRYKRGMTFCDGIEIGEKLEPITGYNIKIPIDTTSSDINSNKIVFYPLCTVPSENKNGPGLTVIRLQLYHYLKDKKDYHKGVDWDIYFELSILYNDQKLTIFPFENSIEVNNQKWQSWRDLTYCK